jgi:hypothetical protein
MTIKEAIQSLEELMNRFSNLIDDFDYGAEKVDAAEMWGKLKDKHERLFNLERAIESQNDGLKQDIDSSIKEIIKERLDRDIIDVKNQLKTVPTLIKKAEEKYISSRSILNESKKQVKEPVGQGSATSKIHEKKSQPAKRIVSPNIDEFEKQHLRNLVQKEIEIKKIYEQSIHEISVGYSNIEWNGRVFKLSDYPELNNRINAQIKKIHAKVYASTVNGIHTSWDLSNNKNNILVDKRLAGKRPNQKGKLILYDPNLNALTQFTARKTAGLNLSDRVWNTLDGYKTEMEAALGVGVSEGTPAAEIARSLKQYLNEPDRLFRRVRQDDGILKLSQAAKNYHPGQGVYRSSFMNANRVARTETNAAYRNADIERWRKLPFVVGYRINLSKNHPEYDICDTLAGVYPLDFNWTAWHPHCLCFLTAEQLSDKDYDKFEDEILAGEKTNIAKIKEMPGKFDRYVERNAERINGWSSKPYWIRDNKSITAPLLNQ